MLRIGKWVGSILIFAFLVWGGVNASAGNSPCNRQQPTQRSGPAEAASVRDASFTSSPSDLNPDEIDSFWTDERLESAEPEDMPTVADDSAVTSQDKC